MTTFSETIRGGYIGIDACAQDCQGMTSAIQIDSDLTADFHDFLTESGWGVRLEEYGMMAHYSLGDGMQVASAFLTPATYKELAAAAGEQFSFLLEPFDKLIEDGCNEFVIHIEKEDDFSI